MALSKSEFLSYLNGLPSKAAHFLSGQHLPEWEDANTAYSQLEVYNPAVTALLGYTILTGSSDNYSYWSSAQSVLSAHATAGGAIVLDIHPPNPWSSNQSIASAWVSNQSAPKNDLVSLINSPTNMAGIHWANVKAKVDGFISKLPQDALIIFRPLHEAVGLHFWWGLDSTNPSRSEAGVRALWVDIVKYLRPKHPNVLFAFSAGMSWYGPLTYGLPVGYDLVGASLYTDNLKFPDKFGSDYSALTGMGAPVFLFEAGSGSGSASWDARTLLTAATSYPKLVGFQSWQDSYALANVQNGAAVMASPVVVNRGFAGSPAPASNVWVATDVSGTVLGVASSQAKAQATWPSSTIQGFVEI